MSSKESPITTSPVHENTNKQSKPPTPSKEEHAFALPSILPALRAYQTKPWDLGYSIGLLLYHISPLVCTHLDNPISFHSPIPRALPAYPSFVATIDTQVAHLRLTDGYVDKLPTPDRKARTRRKKCVERYISIVESAFKSCVREGLGDVFAKYGREETKMCNKGVDKALTGVQWVEYPGEENVVGREGDWAGWLRGRCEVLGRERVRRGEGAVEGM